AAAPRELRQSHLESLDDGIDRMAGRRNVGRIEQNECIEAKADLKRMLHGGAARHGMEDPGRFPRSQFHRYIAVHPLQIAAELGIGVIGGGYWNIFAVVAKIENDE